MYNTAQTWCSWNSPPSPEQGQPSSATSTGGRIRLRTVQGTCPRALSWQMKPKDQSPMDKTPGAPPRHVPCTEKRNQGLGSNHFYPPHLGLLTAQTWHRSHKTKLIVTSGGDKDFSGGTASLHQGKGFRWVREDTGVAKWALQPGTRQVSRQNHSGHDTNQDISAQMRFHSGYEYFQNHISNRRDLKVLPAPQAEASSRDPEGFCRENRPLPLKPSHVPQPFGPRHSSHTFRPALLSVSNH